MHVQLEAIPIRTRKIEVDPFITMNYLNGEGVHSSTKIYYRVNYVHTYFVSFRRGQFCSSSGKSPVSSDINCAILSFLDSSRNLIISSFVDS